jgi:3D (Asp-Asp-Asp) domain-containing protein
MSFRQTVPLIALCFLGCGQTEQQNSSGAEPKNEIPSAPSGSAPSRGESSDSPRTVPPSASLNTAPTSGGDKVTSPVRGKISGLAEAALSFTLPARPFETPARHLWATYYYTPRFTHLEGGIELRDLNEIALGPKLSHRQWCDSAMEGSVQVQMNGEWRTYNYAGISTTVQVDCSRYFKHPVGRTRFKPARGPFGDGVRNFILSPYRTIAVDPDVIPYGTVIYIDAARGLPFTMPDGTRRIHDGYFFAGDTGGLIRDNHVDVYIGIDTVTPFDWITSNSGSRIQYQIVPDNDLKEVLLSIHL